MNTNSYKIADAFTLYLISHQPSSQVDKIIALLVGETPSRKSFDDLCEELGLRHSPSFKEELLDLLLFYIGYCLKDHSLTSDEKSSSRQLKRLFRVKEGDFYKLRRREIKEVLASQVDRILDDKTVNRAEALHQADLQEVFDLSYDQYLELTKEHVRKIVDDLIEKFTADGTVTDEEREELLRRLMALDTVYKLDSRQKKRSLVAKAGLKQHHPHRREVPSRELPLPFPEQVLYLIEGCEEALRSV